MKDQLTYAGVEYSKTHDIDQLIRIGREHHANILVTDYIDDHSDMFSLWEAKARYVLGYLIEYRKIEKAVDEVGKFLSAVQKQRYQDCQKSQDQKDLKSDIPIESSHVSETDTKDGYDDLLL